MSRRTKRSRSSISPPRPAKKLRSPSVKEASPIHGLVYGGIESRECDFPRARPQNLFANFRLIVDLEFGGYSKIPNDHIIHFPAQRPVAFLQMADAIYGST